MTLHVHRSHAMELLAERWIELAFGAPSDPFDTPLIAVQGQGMERWLAQYCANATGVFAGVSVKRVRGFVEEVCDALVPADEAARLDPKTLPFRVMKHLDALLDAGPDTEFARYLDGADEEKRGQLALKLADTFDRYFVHRPQMVRDWLAGQAGDDPLARAEAALMRAIVAESPGYEGKRIELAIARLDTATSLLLTGVPKRIHLFGVGTLAPLYLELIDAVSRVSEVHLFVLTPGESWLSDLSRDEAARGEVGSLIRGFGKLAADFQFLLEGVEGHDSDYLGGELPEPTTVLETLQHDLCTLTSRGDGDGRIAPVVVPPDDRSFVVHACHSPMRELEVLHEILVDLLERDPTLVPGRIAVLTTDVERYAPLVHAVFGRERDATRRIPYHVADRGPRESLGVVDAFFAVLDALDARVTLPLVADLLDRAPIRAAFGVDESEVPTLVDWLRGAGARFGIDGDDRAREELPPFVEHTFERALDRLALGFATPMGAESFAGIAPHASATGKEVAALAGLFSFFEEFDRLRSACAGDAPLDAQLTFCERALDAMLSDEAPHDEEVALVRKAIATLRSRAGAADYAGVVSRAVVVAMLTSELDEGSAGGFLGGGVTFCRQVPMRAIPFRVICLLGLDDGAFPRNVDAPRFDLTGRSPRRGDRTPRDDDRQAFLETLLSARDSLHLFYVGRDVATGTERAMSAVVGRTLDVLRHSVVRSDGGDVDALLVVDHPLQAFDPSYFVADARSHGLVSVDAAAFASARASQGPKALARPELTVDADAPVDEIRFDDLLAFLEKPSTSFLHRVLEVATAEEADSLPDRETLVADGLDRYVFVARALELIELGLTDDAVIVRLREEALLPPGGAGVAVASEAVATARAIGAAFDPGAPRAPVSFGVDLTSHRLVGSFQGVHARGLYRRIASKVSLAKKFRTFVESLMATLLPEAIPGGATLVGRAAPVKTTELTEVYEAPRLAEPDARRALDALVDAFVVSRTTPVLVDADLLATFVKARDEGSSSGEALARSFEEFRDRLASGSTSSELNARRRLFRRSFAPGVAPPSAEILGAPFERVARDAFAPFHEAANPPKSKKGAR